MSSEFQILKEKLNEHSKQLKQSAEMLNQLEWENITFQDENQAPIPDPCSPYYAFGNT